MERYKTVKDTALSLGVTEATVYNLLKRGVLVRGENHKGASHKGGRPVTLILTSSIVSYIKSY